MKIKPYLIASICFYVAAIAAFFTFEDNKAIAVGAFASLGTAFMVLYQSKLKK